LVSTMMLHIISLAWAIHSGLTACSNAQHQLG
jgi:hypothetical protein